MMRIDLFFLLILFSFILLPTYLAICNYIVVFFVILSIKCFFSCYCNFGQFFYGCPCYSILSFCHLMLPCFRFQFSCNKYVFGYLWSLFYLFPMNSHPSITLQCICWIMSVAYALSFFDLTVVGFDYRFPFRCLFAKILLFIYLFICLFWGQ